MPSRRGLEQCLTWLRSKMAERDTLDAINAEICYNVIIDLNKRKKAIGAMYHLTKVENRRKQEEIDILKSREEAYPEETYSLDFVDDLYDD